MEDDDPLLTYQELKHFKIPYRRGTLWKMWRNSEFPAPIQLSANRIAWRTSDIKKWLADRPRKRIDIPPKAKTKAKKRKR